ncbi:hypothetical protein GPECTOR_6g618 [Gonium pectorale]|uniref:Uncharacterized protein n=1 Tax=Gonium pectorale TaxID=33097 RepID=A0A150GV43_GONPE|nr:hypothetical protein GPECTOR_6g618 [Gonium pectorale]|eukprot:KXZ53701.1 hypothetical protein GPECTOR_6g618 [Gonium pectorale]
MADTKRSRKSLTVKDDEDWADEPSDEEESMGSDYEPEEDDTSKRSKKANKENKEPAKKTPKSASKSDPGAITDRLRKSLARSIQAQMVYKKSLKHGSSRINVEIPNLSLSNVEHILGSALYAKASKGPKQVAVTTSGADLQTLFHCSLYKFVYSKESEILKATGLCIMVK